MRRFRGDLQGLLERLDHIQKVRVTLPAQSAAYLALDAR